MRFQISTLDGITWVWDHSMCVPVSNPVYADGYEVRWEFSSADAAREIADILNQRVERPELTRADGKRVDA
jgi:hypothetical protein